MVKAAYTVLFERLWKAYPSRKAKGAAFKAFERLKVEEGELAMLLAAIEVQKLTRKWREGFIPHLSTWLNQRRWEDEIEPHELRGGTRDSVFAKNMDAGIDALRIAAERDRRAADGNCYGAGNHSGGRTN